jgi:hypothetical protein
MTMTHDTKSLDTTLRAAERAGDDYAANVARIRRGELAPGAVLVLNGDAVPGMKRYTGKWVVTKRYEGTRGVWRLSLSRLNAAMTARLPKSLANDRPWTSEEEIRPLIVSMGTPLSLADPGEDTVRSIEQAEMPAAIGNIRRESRKDIAKALRALFKRLDIVGVSVTAPNYSMASVVDVDFTRPEHDCNPDGTIWDKDERGNALPYGRRGCAGCERTRRAEQRLGAIVLAAYPDMDDRSDSMVDHFDRRFSVSSRSA